LGAKNWEAREGGFLLHKGRISTWSVAVRSHGRSDGDLERGRKGIASTAGGRIENPVSWGEASPVQFVNKGFFAGSLGGGEKKGFVIKTKSTKKFSECVGGGGLYRAPFSAARRQDRAEPQESIFMNVSRGHLGRPPAAAKRDNWRDLFLDVKDAPFRWRGAKGRKKGGCHWFKKGVHCKPQTDEEEKRNDRHLKSKIPCRKGGV